MSAANRSRAPSVGFVSLGCPKALVDSENLLTRLRAEGYVVSPTYQAADLVIVNTCGFIDEAIAESLEAIGEALADNGRVIVTGCLGARAELVRNVHPRVLAVTGPHAVDEVMGAVHAHLRRPHEPFFDLLPAQGIKLTPRHYAYLKISEGCNHRCSFCIIPSMRGPLASRPIADVMRDAENLVGAGAKELLVIAQDTSAYGVDLRYRTGFWNGRPVKSRIADLAHCLGELGVWVRLHYVYPYPHVDDLIPLMAEGRLLPYLDIPFQHASPRILRRMKRPAAAEDVPARIRRWRDVCPELVLRSTFIAGFPGETEADFRQLLDFLDEAQLDRVGCFAYSPVEGARANAFPGAIPEELRQERRARLMARQEKISAERMVRWLGRRIEVLVDSVDERGAVARSHADAPEIDGVVHVTDGQRLEVGELAQVTVRETGVHDMSATLAGEKTRRRAGTYASARAVSGDG